MMPCDDNRGKTSHCHILDKLGEGGMGVLVVYLICQQFVEENSHAYLRIHLQGLQQDLRRDLHYFTAREGSKTSLCELWEQERRTILFQCDSYYIEEELDQTSFLQSFEAKNASRSWWSK